MDATIGQPRSGNRTQFPHQLDRQVAEKIQTAACFESARDLPWCGFLRSGGFRLAFAADRNLCLARTLTPPGRGLRDQRRDSRSGRQHNWQ